MAALAHADGRAGKEHFWGLWSEGLPVREGTGGLVEQPGASEMITARQGG